MRRSKKLRAWPWPLWPEPKSRRVRNRYVSRDARIRRADRVYMRGHHKRWQFTMWQVPEGAR